MSKFTTSILMTACVLSASLGMAQQTRPELKNVPLQQTSPASGPQIYVAYCAACHGAKATGNGPTAAALKMPPADLTSLRLKNGGVFPTAHVMSVLQLGVANPAHGSSEMPIWGSVFLTLSSSSQGNPTLVQQRLLSLTNYLKLIQK